MGQKTLKEMLKEANSSIQSINPNKAIDLVGNNEFIFIDLRDKSELLKSGKIRKFEKQKNKFDHQAPLLSHKTKD